MVTKSLLKRISMKEMFKNEIVEEEIEIPFYPLTCGYLSGVEGVGLWWSIISAQSLV